MPHAVWVAVRTKPRGFSLAELLAVVALLGIVAAVVSHRLSDGADAALARACELQRVEAEIQVQRWWRVHGTRPADDLSDIGADSEYFPQGLPTCPCGGGAYTIDYAGRIVGHEH